MSRILTESGQEEIAVEEDGSDPYGAEAKRGEVNEGCGDKNLIGKRIQELAESGDKIELASEVAI